jgi:ATP-dependent helicase HrpB
VSGHLPIDPYVPRIVGAVRRQRAAVVTAAPGAGKTTRVPPALVVDGPVILLQPRRAAARAIAARIAAEQSWTLGREVGWQIRFERRFTADTRLLVVTEGILTARLQSDPLLSGFSTIVLDEFHERSIHADLAIALGRQAWRARDDLRIVVMSATIDAAAVSAFLDGCPVVEVPGRTHPVDIQYAPGQSVTDAACEALGATDGDVLCFLPGAVEIRRAMADIQPRAGAGVDVLPLHGSLSADEQDRALATGTRRRVIVATNIAETSLTVPGVTAVVDAGLQKVARYDADRGIDSLETERITADAADQRAGRAGRVAPGIVRRLWDARDRLRPHREPDIERIDLSATALDVIAWGGDPRTLEWFEAPSPRALDAALTLLARLGLVAGGRLTKEGEQVRRLPLHPRLARMLLAARGSREAVRASALLSERHLFPQRAATTSSDLLSAMDDWDNVPSHVQRAATEIARMAASLQAATFHPPSPVPRDEPEFLRAVLSGYPDRVAQRREPRSPEVLLSSGTGAVLARESGVRDGEFFVALDVGSTVGSARRVGLSGPRTGRDPQTPVVRIASRVEREWLTPTSTDVVHRFDDVSGRVRAAQIDRYDALVLTERPVAVDPEIAARLLADAWIARGPRGDDARLLARLRFAGHDVDLASLVSDAARSARALDDIRIAQALTSAIGRDLDRNAPDTLVVPSGRSVALEYHDDGSVAASVKLQELFGLAETPRIGRKRVPVRLALLAPNGRAVQVTQDLRSFWERTYPEVRKELRGRYPRHPWPEDPWSATPTARTKRRT